MKFNLSKNGSIELGQPLDVGLGNTVTFSFPSLSSDVWPKKLFKHFHLLIDLLPFVSALSLADILSLA